jgi:RimJ/RimL family protein N-acetyltransferase
MRSERLRYEPLAHAHADGLFAALDDPLVGRYIGGPEMTTIAALHDRIEFLAAGVSPSNPDEHWVNVVARRLDDEVIVGRVEATVSGRIAEIAYVFGPVWWGSGYATEATAWLVDHLRARFPIDQVVAAIHPDNLASQRLAERVGLVRVPTPSPAPMSYEEGDVVFVRHFEQSEEQRRR